MRLLLTACMAALLLVACGSAGPSSTATRSPSPSSPTANPPTSLAPSPVVTVNLVDFAIQPAEISVAKGATIAVDNAGKAPHNLSVATAAGKVLAHTPNLQPGRSTALTLDLAPGAYTIYCAEPGHEALGMKGSLRIT
jgi:plastocyanin